MTRGLNMKLGSLLFGTMTTATLASALCGCATGGGGGGGSAGGATQDRLADYQLDDPGLAEDVGTITAADNQAVACLGQDVTYEDEAILAALKAGYPADEPADQFPSFVAETADLEQAKADEICNTTLENASPELLDLVDRMTVAGNLNNECLGEEPDITDQDSLRTIKKGYFGSSVHAYGSLVEFAAVLVEETERVVEDGCP
jgi:hypothetical protein